MVIAMASSITHSYFILDVYEKLDIETKKFLMDYKNTLKFASQGMDPLFFYKVWYPKKGSRIREFGDYFHDNDTLLYFETLINYIKYNGYGLYPEVMAFLYGALSHYVLDSNIHPFVIYQTGIYKKDDISTLKYNMKHGELESLLDCYLVSLREHTLPWKFESSKFITPKIEISSNLKEVIDFTFKETFDIHNMTKFYIRSLRHMKLFFRIFREDSHGIKLKFYKFVDKICPRTYRRKSPLSYHYKMDVSLFNLDHKTWYHPSSKKIKSKTSILDIYNSSVTECVELIQKIQKYIYHDEGNLKNILKNVSYITGRETEKHYEMKYFSF